LRLAIGDGVVHRIFIKQWWGSSSKVIWYLLIHPIGCSEIQRSSCSPLTLTICFHVWHRWPREIWHQVVAITHYSCRFRFLWEALSPSRSRVRTRWCTRVWTRLLGVGWLCERDCPSRASVSVPLELSCVLVLWPDHIQSLSELDLSILVVTCIQVSVCGKIVLGNTTIIYYVCPDISVILLSISCRRRISCAPGV
jgi:hypothetical protein